MSADDGFFAGFLDDYFAECDEHLTGARRSLLAFESSLGQPAAERAAIDELFRYFHSLKGISAMVELRPAEQLAHHLESYLRAIRQRELAVTANGIETMIDSTQRLETVINAHRFQRAQPPIEDVVNRIAQLLVTISPQAETAHVAAAAESTSERKWKCTFAPTRDLMARGIGVDSVRKALAGIGTIVDAAPQVRADGAIVFQFVVRTNADGAAFERLRQDGVVVEPTDAQDVTSSASSAGGAAAPVDEPPPASVSPSHVVRVDLTRLDDLMRSVGDLVISRARLTDRLDRVERHIPASDWRTLQEDIAAIDRQVRTLREGIMRVRLVPIGEIFRRMPFVVLDLARESGKQVKLDFQGHNTEIDKYVIERMMDPVVHLVRNAISHGIEPPEERVARGKPPEGTITLSASAAGEAVTIEVADDGRGIDAEAVIRRAREAGLPVPAEAPDNAALLSLICAPGFSTKDDADRASGRGVGMAVVKTTVEQLSGTMALDTERRVGTRFVIQLPLTLAITDALIGRVGDEAFAVPQGAVREVIEVHTADVRVVEQNEIVPHRGGALTLVRLARLFGLTETPRDRFHVFVVGAGASAVGFAVDRIVGQREVVVRTITDPLVKVDGVSGATDLGDGRVVLILDPAMLSRLTRQRAARTIGGAVAWGRVRA
jgi:two-component system, chemotaxis family, sensor kinase CheA